MDLVSLGSSSSMKKIYFILVCSFFLVQCEPGWIWKIGDDIVESYNQEENVYCIETSACNYNYHNSYYGSEGCVYPNILVPSECDNLCLTYSDSLCVLNCSSNDDLVLSCNDYNIIRNILTMNKEFSDNVFLKKISEFIQNSKRGII